MVSIVCVKKRSESELWESEGHDSDSDLHVDPSFPRVLWPLPNSDEVKKQVDSLQDVCLNLQPDVTNC